MITIVKKKNMKNMSNRGIISTMVKSETGFQEFSEIQREGKVFASQEVCRLLGISKSTLFRWEREDRESRKPPKARRDFANHRCYSASDLDALRTLAFKDPYRAATQSGDSTRLAELHERMALLKFVAGNQLGLLELNEMKSLSGSTLSELLRQAALNIEKNDTTWHAIVAVVAKHAGLALEKSTDSQA